MNKTSPLVSVVVPAYNAEDTLVESVESILQQSYKNIEVIIINDASIDRTWSIMENLCKKDQRIRIFKNTHNLGIAGTRNRGLEVISGKYLAWQDADDISLPERIAIQVSVLENNPDIGIVGGWLEFFSENGTQSYRKYRESDRDIRKTIFRYSPVAQPVSMIRTECFQIVGKYDLKYPPAEDLDMSFRIGTHFSFYNIQQVLLKYRVSEKSATFRQLAKIERSTLEIRWKNLRNTAYHFTFFDLMYNFVQIIFLVLIPPKIKIQLFSIIRNSANI